MKILALDDEKYALEVLVSAIKNVCGDAEIFAFRKPLDAISFLEKENCEVAFVDIEMPGISGIEVAKRIKQIAPHTNIIFQTGYGEYREAAFKLHASGYITKPVMEEDVEKEINDLRYPVIRECAGLRVQTFGNFEVFYHNVPVELGDKAKELLAYLIDRSGASVSNNEMYSILYEDEYGHEENLKKIKKSLIDAMKKIGCDDIIISQRGKLAIDTQKVECDLYDWRIGKGYAINQYRGEYMTQYSWSEFHISEFL